MRRLGSIPTFSWGKWLSPLSRENRGLEDLREQLKFQERMYWKSFIIGETLGESCSGQTKLVTLGSDVLVCLPLFSVPSPLFWLTGLFNTVFLMPLCIKTDVFSWPASCILHSLVYLTYSVSWSHSAYPAFSVCLHVLYFVKFPQLPNRICIAIFKELVQFIIVSINIV